MPETAASDLEKRLFPRWNIGEQGAIRVQGVSSACTAIDISAGGVKVKTHAHIGIDDEFLLELDGIVPLTARVVRVEQGCIAAHFTRGPHYLFR